MSSTKTIHDLLSKPHISNGDIRYTSVETKKQIELKTEKCTGGLRERIFWLQTDIIDYPKCTTCNNPLTSKNFRTNVKGGCFTLHCSVRCAKRDLVVIQKQKATCVAKYGTDHYLGSNIARRKIETTNRQTYGEIIPHPWGSDKQYQYMLKKYGVKNSRHIQNVNDKIIRGQIITNIESGKTHSSITRCQSRRNVECQNAELAFDPNRAKLEDIEFIWKHYECGKNYTSCITDGCINTCPHCNSGASMLELSLRGIIISMTKSEIKFNVRDVIPKRELDIFIPDKKIAFEFNGIYWHNTDKKPDRYYHLSKTEECKKRGIKLIHIWEHDFVKNFELIKSMVGNIMGLSVKLDARKCKIQQINSTQATDFHNKNHVDGNLKAKINLGLFYKDTLVSVMSFGLKRFQREKQNNSWEIYRFCTIRGHQVRGGAAKLFKKFITLISPKKITSFCDRSLGGGNVYTNIGMTEIAPTPPGYFWANTHSELTISRYRTQKRKLKKLLGDQFDETQSETVNMKKAGWFKLWDCGNRVFTWES